MNAALFVGPPTALMGRSPACFNGESSDTGLRTLPPLATGLARTHARTHAHARTRTHTHTHTHTHTRTERRHPSKPSICCLEESQLPRCCRWSPGAHCRSLQSPSYGPAMLCKKLARQADRTEFLMPLAARFGACSATPEPW